ncbi:hypothetical protein SSCG_00409 [Streptomyces clavuligerus]|nr:hypothetical protein SSCG_00409 [Streptomyces clavuligerus]
MRPAGGGTAVGHLLGMFGGERVAPGAVDQHGRAVGGEPVVPVAAVDPADGGDHVLWTEGQAPAVGLCADGVGRTADVPTC